MAEKWRDAPGFEGYYEVSDLGRIRSHPVLIDDGKRRPHYLGQSGKVLKLIEKPSGHLHVTLYRNGVRKQAMIHRLVCEAFNGPSPQEGAWVLHNDGDPKNNTPANLRWGDAKDNMDDSLRHGVLPIGEKSPAAKLTDDQVREFLRITNAGEMTVTAAARLFGIHRNYGSVLRKGGRRKCITQEQQSASQS